MSEAQQDNPVRTRPQTLGAQQVARQAEVRQSANGVRFATFGETGVASLDLDRMIGAVPESVAAVLGHNTYYFVPLAMRDEAQRDDTTLIAAAYSEELDQAATCHRNVELGSGRHGVFISTRLMNDRFALCFEFFINVANAYIAVMGVPAEFERLLREQILAGQRGETSMDAWEQRHLALGEAPAYSAQPGTQERGTAPRRSFGALARIHAAAPTTELTIADPEQWKNYAETACVDAIAIYLLSLALDFDYSELREREYPLIEPAALAERLRTVSAIIPANSGYQFEVAYRRR